MSAITPQTALPARSVTPSGAVTCNSSRLRLYAVIDATQGEASLKLVRQLEGGDWQYVPGGSLSISAYTNAADKVNELIVPNAGAGTVYHVVGVGSTAVLATIRCYLAEIVDSVVTGTVTTDGVQELTNKTLTDSVIKNGLTASGSVANDWSGSTGTFLTSSGAGTLSGHTTVAAGKNLILAAGAGNLDASASTGAIKLGASTATLGFFGATAVSRTSAYTLTYSTTDRTSAAVTSNAITDSSGGSASTSALAAVTELSAAGSADTTPVKNNFATLAAELALVKVDLLAMKKNVAAILTDLRAYGLFQ